MKVKSLFRIFDNLQVGLVEAVSSRDRAWLILSLFFALQVNSYLLLSQIFFSKISISWVSSFYTHTHMRVYSVGYLIKAWEQSCLYNRANIIWCVSILSEKSCYEKIPQNISSFGSNIYLSIANTKPELLTLLSSNKLSYNDL